MEQNDNNENPPEKKKASYDDSRQGAERMMRKEIAEVFTSREDEKRLDADIHRMFVTRENAERLAENLAGHLTSEITGFADMMKANAQNVRLVEEKVARLSREMEDIRKIGAGRAVDERMSKLEALCNVLNEKLSRQDELGRAGMSKLEALCNVLNEKLSRQDELGRAVMAVLDDFKARMDDYPTRGEIDPIWKEAETVILDGMNRQRGDLKALIAALDEDYKDGAISEKTYRETKEKTEEKLSVIEDKIKRFVEAAADRGRAVAERPASPTTEREKLAEAKLADIRKREERLSVLEKKLEDSNGFIGGRLGEFEKKISELSRKGDGAERLSRLETRMGELGGRIEELGMTGVEAGPGGEKRRRMPQPPEAREQRQRGPAAGGLLGRILGIERESGEITPMMAPVAVPAAGKPIEPEKIRIELEAPLAPAIMAPLLPYGPEEKHEKRLKAELESLEAMLGRLKEQRQKVGGAPRGGHENVLSKLMGQRTELEGLLKMVEKKHAEGAIEISSYVDIRQRTLERLSRINELLLGQNK